MPIWSQAPYELSAVTRLFGKPPPEGNHPCPHGFKNYLPELLKTQKNSPSALDLSSLMWECTNESKQMHPCLQEVRQETGRAQQCTVPCCSSCMALVHPWGWNPHHSVSGSLPLALKVHRALADGSLSPSSLWRWFLWAAWDVSGRDLVFITSCYGWRWCLCGDSCEAGFDLVHQCLLWEFKPLSLTCPGQSLGGFPLNKEPSNLISCLALPVSLLFEDSICHGEVSQSNLWVKVLCAHQSSTKLEGHILALVQPHGIAAGQGLAAIGPGAQVPIKSLPRTWPFRPPFSLQ